jgi:hypothetical protein
MTEGNHAVVVSGLDLSGFLSLLPPLGEEERGSDHLWPDCNEDQIAIAEAAGFILATGGLFALIGEGFAHEASRHGAALYLCENTDDGEFCAARFNKRRPTGRVEVSAGDIIEDSMKMFPADGPDNDDKRYGQINTGEVLLGFMGGECPLKLDWTYYKTPSVRFDDD